MQISINGVTISNNMMNPMNVLNPVGASKQDKSGNVLFAGDMPGVAGAAGRVDEKRAMARKQVRSLIKEAWDKDIAVSKSIEDLEKAKKAKFDEIQSYRNYMDKIDKYKSKYIEDNGIDTDSAEHKDLLLLEKYQDYKNGVPVDNFSKEEVERLKELQNTPRTDYQNMMLAINADRGDTSNALYKAEQQLEIMMQQYSESLINQPKTETMDKVQDAADKIMDAVNDDAISEFVKEGIDNTEENMEKTKEEAQKIQEEREERQKQIDEAKERRKEQEELLDDAAKTERIDYRVQNVPDNYSNIAEAQEKVRQIMKRTNMEIEDLKGIEIDFNY